MIRVGSADDHGLATVQALSRYDAACRALAEAKSVDEVKDVRDRAEAMRAYARQAKNKQLEVDAAEIRIRAERRLGEMIAGQRDAGLLNKGAAVEGVGKRGLQENPHSLPTLAEAGIDKNLADRARKLAAIPETEFTEIVSDWRERIQRENERVSINLLRSGERHTAAKPAPADPVTVNGYDSIVEAWTAATPADRDAFIAFLRVSGAIPSSDGERPAEAAGSEHPEGDQFAANAETGHVDRSAERASSAVEVGAPVSPERARSMSMTPIEPREANGLKGFGFTVNFEDTPSDGDAFSEVKGMARPENAAGVEPSLSDIDPQPSSSQAADPAGDAPPPASPATIPGEKPGCLKLRDGHCKLSFPTSALCSPCNNARMKARAA